MPQQPFVMRVHFYLPEGHGTTSRKSGAHHVSYMGAGEKRELLVEDTPARWSTLESAATHAKYAGERPGNLRGYLGALAADPQAAQKSILAAQGPVWRTIVSVGEGDALAMGGNLTTQAGWEQAANAVVPQMVKQLGLDPAKVQWIAAAHRYQKHEQNPHLHLLLWEEGAPSRKTAKWTDKERRAIRKAWISALYAPERARLGQEKTAARQDARTLIQFPLATLKEAGNSTQGFRRELTMRLQHLGTHLPGQGRLAYAYMPSEVKRETETVIRWLWEHDPALKAAHDRYLQSAEALGTFYWHSDPNRTPDSPGRQAALQTMRDRAEADLIQRVAAPVLKAAHQTTRQTAYPPGLTPHLTAALHRIMHQAAQDAARTAVWLAESEYQRQKAEIAMARNTGQELAW